MFSPFSLLIMLEVEQNCSFMCLAVFSAFMFLTQSALKMGQFIFVFFLIATVGKSSAAIVWKVDTKAVGVSWPHTIMAAVCSKESITVTYAFSWDLWRREIIIQVADRLITEQGNTNIYQGWLKPRTKKLWSWLKSDLASRNLINTANTKAE